MNCNMNIKDNFNKTSIERASENNAFRVIKFLDSYSYYPFQTLYFLQNEHRVKEFDFLPDDITSVL